MLQNGDLIGGTYRLERLLGKGGMGEVWLARHTLLEEYRAIKIVLGEIANDPQLRDRFIKGEARNSLKLERHPNIVRVYELGQHEGMPYMVMEYIEGVTLRQILNQRKTLPPRETGFFLNQIAQALDAAHRQGLIHRDIKPGNVLVDPKGTAKLGDFGLTKNLEGSKDDSLTSTGTYMGTPAYVAPEQIHGHADQRSDIYSLGAMVYEMLAGRPPFVGIASSVIVQQVTTPPPSMIDFNPGVPVQVQTVVNRALAKNPDNRFQTATQFAAAYYQAIVESEKLQVQATTPTGEKIPAMADSLSGSTVPSEELPTIPTTPSRGTTPPPVVIPTANQTPSGIPIPAIPVGSNPPTGTPFSAEPLLPSSPPEKAKFPLGLVIGLSVAALVLVAIIIVLVVLSGNNNGDKGSTTIANLPQITPTYTLPARSDQPVVNGVLENRVLAADLSPDGKLIAAGYQDNSVHLFDLNGKEVIALTGHRGPVLSVAFSSDSKQLVSCGEDSQIRLWEVPSGKLLRTLEGHENRVFQCRFVDQNNQLYSLGEDRTRRLWNLATGNQAGSYQVEDARFNEAAVFSPDGSLLASPNGDQAIEIVPTSSVQDVKPAIIPAFTSNGSLLNVQGLGFNNDNSQLAINLSDGSIRLWELRNNAQRLRLDVNAYDNTPFSFSANGKWLAYGNSSGIVSLLDLEFGKVVTKARLHERTITAIKFLSGDSQLATASYDNTLKLSEVSSLKVVGSTGQTSLPYRNLMVSPEGRVIAFSNNQSINVFDVTSGKLTNYPDVAKENITGIAFSPDGKRLAATAGNDLLYIWDTGTTNPILEQPVQGGAHSLAYSPGGKYLAVGSYQQVQIYDTATNRPVNQLKTPESGDSYPWGLSFISDKQVVVAWSGGQLMSYDPGLNNDAGKLIKKFDLMPRAMALAPDGRKLGIITQDQQITILEIASGKVLVTHDELKDNGVYWLAFNRKSDKLVTASYSEIWIWQGLAQNSQVTKYVGHTNTINGFAFILNDNYGFSISDDGTYRLWKL